MKESQKEKTYVWSRLLWGAHWSPLPPRRTRWPGTRSEGWGSGGPPWSQCHPQTPNTDGMVRRLQLIVLSVTVSKLLQTLDMDTFWINILHHNCRCTCLNLYFCRIIWHRGCLWILKHNNQKFILQLKLSDQNQKSIWQVFTGLKLSMCFNFRSINNSETSSTMFAI